ncbi:MAG: hypothetical protein AAGI23_08550 [Bacteroidota bacterium]
MIINSCRMEQVWNTFYLGGGWRKAGSTEEFAISRPFDSFWGNAKMNSPSA